MSKPEEKPDPKPEPKKPTYNMVCEGGHFVDGKQVHKPVYPPFGTGDQAKK